MMLLLLLIVMMIIATIGAIHTINDESDYAYDMKRPKLRDAMFNEDDIFILPSFDEKIYYDDSMPPIYDDYIEVGLEECQLYEVMIPLFWRMLNLIVIIIKVDLERS